MNADQNEDDAALGSFGDAVDMAAKVPTLTGVLVALVAGSFVWAWQQFRLRRMAN